MSLGFFLLMLVAKAAFATSSCSELGHKVDGQSAALAEMLDLQRELEEKFQTKIAADVSAQTDGILDELSRNEAIKVAFAKKRLAKNIESKRVELAASQNEYCFQCRGEILLPDLHAKYCSRCPQQKGCD
jgi:hypothetical protein